MQDASIDMVPSSTNINHVLRSAIASLSLQPLLFSNGIGRSCCGMKVFPLPIDIKSSVSHAKVLSSGGMRGRCRRSPHTKGSRSVKVEDIRARLGKKI